MKHPRKAVAITMAGLAGLVMMATQGLASGDHRAATADDKGRLAHMSQGGGENLPMRGGDQGRMGPGGGMGQRMMMPGGELGQGMMGPGGVMGRGMMMPRGGRDHGFGKPITPMTHLSVEDVRHALEHRLEWHGNKRLKIGNVKIDDDDMIVVEIVTLDDSLVRRLKVDRHTGRVQRVE